MHFNELIMRWRLQGIGGLAALVTAGGVAIKSMDPGQPVRGAVMLGSLALSCIWFGVAAIDLWYYRQLLKGAVDTLLLLEKGSEGALDLSTTIEDRARWGATFMPFVFYACGAAPLALLFLWACLAF